MPVYILPSQDTTVSSPSLKLETFAPDLSFHQQNTPELSHSKANSSEEMLSNAKLSTKRC